MLLFFCFIFVSISIFLNKVKEITNKEVGDAIKAAREYRGLNRA